MGTGEFFCSAKLLLRPKLNILRPLFSSVPFFLQLNFRKRMNHRMFRLHFAHITTSLLWPHHMDGADTRSGSGVQLRFHIRQKQNV